MGDRYLLRTPRHQLKRPPERLQKSAATTAPAIVESTPTDAAATNATAQSQPVEPPAPKIEEITLQDLNGAFGALEHESAKTAEFGPLRERYLEYAGRGTTSATEKKYALVAAERLQVRAEAQKRLFELEELRRKNNREKEDVDAVLTRIQAPR